MDFLDKIGQGQIVPVLAITLGALVGAIAIISGCLTAHARLRHDAELRKNMLDRGMSAAEVEVAMRGFGAAAASTLTVEEGLAYDGELAKSLAVSHYSPEAIDYILRAFHSVPANEKESICTAIQEMAEEKVGEDQLIAAVRGLCRAGEARRPFNSSAAAEVPSEMRS